MSEATGQEAGEAVDDPGHWNNTPGISGKWALPEPDIMRALEYFIEHEGPRPPFVQWRDEGKRATFAKPWPEITQPKEKAEFTVVL